MPGSRPAVRADAGLGIGALGSTVSPATRSARPGQAGAQRRRALDPELDLLDARRPGIARDEGLGRERGLPPGSTPLAGGRQLVEPQRGGERQRAPQPPKRRETSSRAQPGTVLDVRNVGPAVRIFRVARPEGFAFEAGQSVKLGVEGGSVRRSYSIASAPQDPDLEFCIEAVPGGRLTSQLFDLAPGDRIEVGPKPKGDLRLSAGRRRHVMVATVTGIAPLRSLLRDALGTSGAGPGREFWVLHGASYADELPFAEELEALARTDGRVRYVPTVSRPSAARNRGWAGQQGRVDVLVLPTLRALGSKQDVAVYACGHPEMVRSVRERLTALGYLVLDEAFD